MFAGRVFAEQPHAQHRHERARQKIRRHHRKTHGHRQRRKQRTRCTGHEKRGRENREHAEHCEQSRHRSLQRGIVGRAGHGCAAMQMRVDVFDGHRRFVHEDAHSERESAERHEMDALPRDPQRERCRQQRDGNIDHHDERASHAAQKEQHHQPRQRRADGAFFDEVADGPQHHRRLVHSERHLHVVGDCRLKLRKVRPHQIHDRERRGIGAFRYRHVHGAAAIHERVAGDDVGLIIHGGHIAHIHRAGGRHADGHGFEVLRIFHHRVHRDDGVLVAEVHVSTRA